MTAGYLKSRAGVAGEFSERIDALFAEWDRDGSPGVVLAVSHRGSVIHQRGYGVANVEDDVPFTVDTVLRLGSTSKHLCASAVLLLETRGALGLDDDIRRFVPEVPDYGASITLRHLMTMTSGLWDGINVLLFAGLDTGSPVTREQLLRLCAIQRELMFRPGDDCSYSNTNYLLLSLVIERVSGRSIADFMRAEIFEPLGMLNTRLTPFMTETIRNKAKGYQPAADGRFEAGYMMIELDGAGGVDSTLADMLKWLANYRDDRHFGADYRRRIEAQSFLNDGRLLDYRLGIRCQEYRGLEVVRHAGGMPGYVCDFVFYPEPDLGIVLLANVLDADILEQPDRIADIVLADEFDLPGESAFVDSGLDEFARIRGVYASEADELVVEVADVDGALVCYLLGEVNPLQLRAAWLESTKNLVSLRLRTPSVGPEAGILLRLGCEEPYLLLPVDDPRAAGSEPGFDPREFCGRYYHDCLEEVHAVTAADGGLNIQIASPIRNLAWNRLAQVVGDLFVAPIDGEPSCTNVTVKFFRDRDGKVCSMSCSLNRCRGLFFRKLGTGEQVDGCC